MTTEMTPEQAADRLEYHKAAHYAAPADSKLFPDLIEALEMGAAALRAQQWRQIETAPRDGTNILLHQKWMPDEPFIGYWSKHGDWSAAKYAVDTSGNALVVDDFGSPDHITHWMPLPAPPVETKA